MCVRMCVCVCVWVCVGISMYCEISREKKRRKIFQVSDASVWVCVHVCVCVCACVYMCVRVCVSVVRVWCMEGSWTDRSDKTMARLEPGKGVQLDVWVGHLGHFLYPHGRGDKKVTSQKRKKHNAGPALACSWVIAFS